jgi:uncharacterized protein YndB with AHSA1/START domain
MAAIHKEIHLDASPEQVWDALRDWGAPHERLVPGFVVDTKLDGDDRLVTFFNGVTVRELLVDLDEDRRRLVWSVREGPYTHHNGVAQVFEDGAGATRFVWTADVLPNETAERTAQMMDAGLGAIKKKLESGG